MTLFRMSTMWVLILTISLQTKFNHALDINTIENIASESICDAIATHMTEDLKKYNSDVQTSHRCEKIQ